jgi:hypothetical protein
MCSILIFAKPDNDHPDPSLDWQKFKRGYVIDIHDSDDFYWGNDIQGAEALGWWRVVVVPGAPASALQSLTAGDVPPNPVGAYRLRTNKIDLDILERGKKLKKTDTLPVELADFLALRSIVPPVVNLHEIGKDPKDIG